MIPRWRIAKGGDSVKSAVEALREARHYALRIREIRKVHVTIDFYLRLCADSDYYSIAPIHDVNNNISKIGPEPLFGRPCEVHREPREKPFWFEGEDGKEIIYTAPVGR